jgi:hypothetical protein
MEKNYAGKMSFYCNIFSFLFIAILPVQFARVTRALGRLKIIFGSLFTPFEVGSSFLRQLGQ